MNGTAVIDAEISLQAVIARDRRKVLHMGLAAFGNGADAEDIAQDVFIRIWQRIQQGHTLDDIPSAWVMRVTINVIRDRMRSHWYRRVTVDAAAGLLHEVPSAEDQALRDHPSALLDAVRRLPIDQQDIVLLFYVADQSLQAISEMLGIRASTVKTRLHRARGRLARILGNERRTSGG